MNMTQTNSTVKRPVMQYYGGKWRLAKWIISHFPKHHLYCEVFGGAASVLMRKEPSVVEVYNDIDSSVVNLFRVLRDPDKAAELQRLLELTPYSREELRLCLEPSSNDVESARRLLVKVNQSIGHNLKPRNPEWRIGSANACRVCGWVNYTDNMALFTERLRNVHIENSTWQKMFELYDSPSTLFYLDPPYVASTRHKGSHDNKYKHELTDSDHVEFCHAACKLQGMAVISGYDCEIYRDILADWKTETLVTRSRSNKPKTETLWINRACQEALERGLLFTEP
jgi:DNA adenine methylase